VRRLFAIAMVLFATNAGADTIWQKAKQPAKPGLLSNDEVHRQVALAYHRAAETRTSDPIFGAQAIMVYEGAKNLLLRHDAAKSSDPRLRYDLGLVLAKLNRWAEAAEVLENAYGFAKDHPLAEDGVFELAICYSKLGEHAKEEGAYLRALDTTDRQFHKATIYSNLAESRLAQGKLLPAIEAAEIAISLDTDNPAPRYNRAVLLDRLGLDLQALEEAKHAVEYDPTGEFIDGPGVFFEPKYERHWYHALRALALAEREVGEERTKLLMSALVSYQQWLEESDPLDRYRKRCEEAIVRLEKQLKLKKK
jgi:tetratricopeptide (TPR) repeat protein